MRILAYSMILLCLAACFQTRPVEPPSSSTSDWITPTDYTILLQNLETAIAQENTQNYARCFEMEALAFEPAASLYNDNEAIWQSWGSQDEETWFNGMLADLTADFANNLSLTETDLQDVTADSLRYVGNYSLRISHPDSTITQTFKGQLQFFMRLNEFNEWTIERWQDIETAPDSSWSLLKLKYVQ